MGVMDTGSPERDKRQQITNKMIMNALRIKKGNAGLPFYKRYFFLISINDWQLLQYAEGGDWLSFPFYWATANAIYYQQRR